MEFKWAHVDGARSGNCTAMAQMSEGRQRVKVRCELPEGHAYNHRVVIRWADASVAAELKWPDHLGRRRLAR